MFKGKAEIDPHKDLPGAIRQVLDQQYLESGLFKLIELEEKKNWIGGVIVELATESGIIVRFTRDRGALYAEMIVDTVPVKVDAPNPERERTFSLNEVLWQFEERGDPPKLGGQYDEDVGFINMLRLYSALLHINWDGIARAFDAVNQAETVRKIVRHRSLDATAYLLRPLTRDFVFLITKIHYDDATSRVDLVEVMSEEEIGFRFWHDGNTGRGAAYFRDQPDIVFGVADLFEAVTGKTIDDQSDYLENVTYHAPVAIAEFWPEIRSSLTDHRDDTIAKIRTIEEMKRAGTAPKLPRYKKKPQAPTVGFFDEKGNPIENIAEYAEKMKKEEQKRWFEKVKRWLP